MFKPRPGEPSYAFVPDAEHPADNRYGLSVETVPPGHALRGKSLNINGDDTVGENPNRYKQHGFYFNADNCISCHACEAACSEKNDLPAHIAFRSVGYVEGGSYPAYTRMNISMACNHCDDPVCLKGCPTLAYTKFAEYGAVLQDPDICFGCGYCTWVCPYNAPQLDTQAGHVSKCNMCVDRLEVGLKPACASACLAGALDFGVVETKPENREQLETAIPGFPSPEITHPNIRFQQTRSLPKNMTRTDSAPLRYERAGSHDEAPYRPTVDQKRGPARWNLAGLRTREDPLVVFTLISQAVIGAFALLFLGAEFGLPGPSAASHPVAWPLLLFSMIGLQTLGLILSTLHLGRPHRFYRAFNNLRYSPVSREVAGIAVFYNFFGLYAVFSGLPMLWTWLPPGWLAVLLSATGWGALLAGVAALYFMHRIYRIPARPFWDHWQVLTAFFGAMAYLGGAAVAVVSIATGHADATALGWYGAVIAAGLFAELIGLVFHRQAMRGRGGEGEAALYEQATSFGKTANLRYGLLLMGLLLAIALTASVPTSMVYWLALAAIVTANALIGRALFYALVIPTTMPGAFFWRNKGFEEHARETGLAHMPQVGVVADAH